MKRSLADGIEMYIKALIARSDNGQIEIQRAEIADTFRCARSQVTYVLRTRFTDKEGYHTESHRGGRGFMRISAFAPGELSRTAPEGLDGYLDDLLAARFLNERETELLRYVGNEIAAQLPGNEEQLHLEIAAALQRFLEMERHKQGG